MLSDVKHPGERPKVGVLCGSTRFHQEMHALTLHMTLDGYIVLVVGSHNMSDDELGITEMQKVHLEALHRHKMDMAEEVHIVAVDGYIGESTRRELMYAIATGKPVFFHNYRSFSNDGEDIER